MKNKKIPMILGVILISILSINIFSSFDNSLETYKGVENPKGSDTYNVEFVRSLGSHELLDGAFKRAGALAMNSSGYLYIYDEMEYSIQVFDQAGGFYKKFGELGSEPGNFSNVEYMAFNDSDYLYVAEPGRIQIFDPDMNYIDSFSSSLDTFFWPEGLYINSTGYVYVADAYNSSIQVFSPDGTYLRRIGGNGDFDSPRAIQINSTGYIYILNDGNNSILIYDPNESYYSEMAGVVSVGRDMKFNDTGHLYLIDYDLEIYNPDTSFNKTITSPNTNGFSDHIFIDSSGNYYCRPGEDDFTKEYTMNGEYIQSFGHKAFSEPGQNNIIGDIAINGTGYYYLTDSINNRIQIYTPNGQYLSQFGEYGTGLGQFDNPKGIDINATGHVYVTDTYNNRIVIFDQNGNYISDFGQYGSGDGDFRDLEDVVVNDTGFVYVADRYYERIQYFTQDGTFIGNWNVESTSFSEIYSLDINSTGHVFVTDEDDLTEAIQIYTWNGTLVHSFGDKTGSGNYDFSSPKGIALDSDSNIFAADTGHHRILIYDSMGNYLFQFGQYGSDDGDLVNPSEVMINSSGYIHVVDSMYRVQIFRFTISTGPESPILNEIFPSISTTGIIDLSWSEPTFADNYTIYRYSQIITNMNYWQATEIASEISGSSHQDVWKVEGDWWYAIVAHNETGDSLISLNQMVTIDLPTPNPPTLNLIDPAISATGIIQLEWSQPLLADNYSVYRYFTEITDSNLASTTEIASEISAFTHQDNWAFEGEWWYAVVAHNETGTSLVSNSRKVIIDLPNASTPILDDILPNPSENGTIVLNWNHDPLVSSYTVLRYSAEILSNNYAQAEILITGLQFNIYTDTLTEDGTYWYAIIAVNATGQSAVSESKMVTVEISENNKDEGIDGYHIGIIGISFAIPIIYWKKKIYAKIE